jgi:DNA invertase Pin-like site-specific DNA recombinase
MLELDIIIKNMPRAYSYIRFSTPEQSKGDSLRRQLEKSKKYAEENGLILDSSLMSADGQNQPVRVESKPASLRG